MDDNSNELHVPGRADRLESLEAHLRAASCLARALWVATTSETPIQDSRDRAAFEELASAVADHSSAALFAFYREGKKP